MTCIERIGRQVLSFSALQRAENSSIFSASARSRRRMKSFSALQRAENSSIADVQLTADNTYAFQCSSASRKFLNLNEQCSVRFIARVSVLFSEPKIPQSSAAGNAQRGRTSFSALQRAENSSIDVLHRQLTNTTRVSVLFSEPKIPQSLSQLRRRDFNQRVSVLFSEPKIPQCSRFAAAFRSERSFSALQRAENSSIDPPHRDQPTHAPVSVLFSEPKIPQLRRNVY